MQPRPKGASSSDGGTQQDRRALPAEGLQLHLGSGPHAQPGWINVDKSWVAQASRFQPLVRILAKAGILSEHQRNMRWPDEIVRMDLTKRLVWDDDSVRAIYSSHMVEHLSRGEARHVLGQCRRVLAPGGVLRLVLPNLNAAVKRYLGAKSAGDPAAADALIEFLYFTPEHDGASRLQQAVVRLLHRPHLWMYDAESLREILSEIGFSPVSPCGFRQGLCPDLDSLETRCEDLFRDDSFYVEAFKS